MRRDARSSPARLPFIAARLVGCESNDTYSIVPTLEKYAWCARVREGARGV